MLIKTHTRFMTYKEYKRLFLRIGTKKNPIESDVITRTHIYFFD